MYVIWYDHGCFAFSFFFSSKRHLKSDVDDFSDRQVFHELKQVTMMFTGHQNNIVGWYSVNIIINLNILAYRHFFTCLADSFFISVWSLVFIISLVASLSQCHLVSLARCFSLPTPPPRPSARMSDMKVCPILHLWKSFLPWVSHSHRFTFWPVSLWLHSWYCALY